MAALTIRESQNPGKVSRTCAPGLLTALTAQDPCAQGLITVDGVYSNHGDQEVIADQLRVPRVCTIALVQSERDTAALLTKDLLASFRKIGNTTTMPRSAGNLTRKKFKVAHYPV